MNLENYVNFKDMSHTPNGQTFHMEEKHKQKVQRKKNEIIIKKTDIKSSSTYKTIFEKLGLKVSTGPCFFKEVVLKDYVLYNQKLDYFLPDSGRRKT